jgi:hypothetical protein
VKRGPTPPFLAALAVLVLWVLILGFVSKAAADPYTGPGVTEAMVYIHDSKGQTAVGFADVLGGPFVGCFARWENMPKVDCYEMTETPSGHKGVYMTRKVTTRIVAKEGT